MPSHRTPGREDTLAGYAGGRRGCSGFRALAFAITLSPVFLAAPRSAPAHWPVLAAPLPPEQHRPSPLRRIGYLSPAPDTRLLEAFREGLRDVGWIEGRDIAIEVRSADRHYERPPQPTRFELVINLRTAKALSLAMPPSILMRAAQVIQ